MVEMKDLAPIVLTLVLVGFIIAVAVIIQSRTYTGFADTNNFNESVTCVNNTPVVFTTTWIKELTFVGNGSDDLIIGSSNYSTTEFDQYQLYITCIDTTCELCGTIVADIEGTFKDVANSEASSATNSILSATKDIATSWMGLIITVIVMAIILGLVMGSFMQQRR